jgi:cell division protein ZapB
MDNTLPKTLESELLALEATVGQLNDEVKNLRQEKTLLTERLNSVNSERAQLLNKNAVVQSRVEAMITRLKSIEQA